MTTSIASAVIRPFGFLDLPTEIRIIVYGRLLQHVDSFCIHESRDESTAQAAYTAATTSEYTSILFTCKRIHHEARPFLNVTRLVFTTDIPMSIPTPSQSNPTVASPPPPALAVPIPCVHRSTITTLTVQAFHLHRLLPIPETFHTILPNLRSLRILTAIERPVPSTWRDQDAPQFISHHWVTAGSERCRTEDTPVPSLQQMFVWNNSIPRHLGDILGAMKTGRGEHWTSTGSSVLHKTFRFQECIVVFRMFLVNNNDDRIVKDVTDATLDYWNRAIMDVSRGEPAYLDRPLGLRRGHMWRNQTHPCVFVETVGDMADMEGPVDERIEAWHRRTRDD